MVKGSANVEDVKELTDPRERFPKPPFPQPKQTPPGNSNDLNPSANYGEDSYTGHGKLLGRAALITGGDSGIGRAIALCFAKEGADIVFSYLAKEEEDAKQTTKLVEGAGRRAVAVAGWSARCFVPVRLLV